MTYLKTKVTATTKQSRPAWNKGPPPRVGPEPTCGTEAWAVLTQPQEWPSLNSDPDTRANSGRGLCLWFY